MFHHEKHNRPSPERGGICQRWVQPIGDSTPKLELIRYLIVKNRKINVNETDFISLTDMTGSFKEGSGLIGKWVTNKNTLEYLGIWEKINNPNFNYTEFGVINPVQF